MFNFSFKEKAARRTLLTIIKFIFAAVLTVLAYFTAKEPSYLVVGLIELALIFVIYNLLVDTTIVFRILADLLFFIYVAQMLVLYFGNSFVTLTMLKNVQFLQDLGGRAVAYILGTVIVLAIVFMPGQNILHKVNKKILLAPVIILLIVEIALHGSYKRFSPVQSFGTIFASEIRYQKVKRASVNPEIARESYYQSSFEDGIKKPTDLPENPNIIVIFTEGLSSNVIYDNRDVMPNLKALEKESLSFTNYYNHTFPTLRGVQGQLYSGYKLDDNEVANNLISVQSILKKQGYTTSFINVEPINDIFIEYCNNLGFDNVITDIEHCTGEAKGMTDGEAYRLLMDSAYELSEGDDPFFLSIYTFGTHVSFNTPDENVVFDDGSNEVLNRFYYLDKEFGEFLDEFKASDLADNTILVFTTDHATYADQTYMKAFPDYKRECTDVDSIPFFIYYKGIDHQQIDVNGKNSLCFAPTLLDYLDINSENYFLGTSLFDDKASSDFDTVFYDASYLVSTKDGQVRYLEDLEVDDFLSQVLSYYTAVE
ncbi:MAG: LTA synthase family protein [Pseudobutyrivibrio sp.]|nr:LTA synthase family protein [Pseudobutyrivibrio sp.]